MALTSEQWIDASLSLSLVAIFCLSIFSSLNVEAQPDSINVQNTVITAPLTVVVPITVDVQNAQVCASVLSSGSQTCNQVVLNPEQTSYTNVDVDLSTATPSLTTAEQEPTAAASTTAEPTQTAPTTTTTEPAPTEEPPTTTEESEEGGTTTEDTGTAEEPSNDGGSSEGGTEAAQSSNFL